MSLRLSGIGISRGIVIGRTHRLMGDWPDIAEQRLPASRIEGEIQRYRNALAAARDELAAVRDDIRAHTPQDIAAFIDAHLLMLRDSTLSEAVMRIISERSCNAEWALKLQRDELIATFENIDNPYLRGRRDDVDQVVKRVQRILVNEHADRDPHQLPDSGEPVILLAEDLGPAELVAMSKQGRMAAFVTEVGGPLSHTAILARSLRIPGVVGLRNARRLLREQELLIVDGRHGTVIAAPEAAEIEHFRATQREEKRYQQRLGKLRHKPALTADSEHIHLLANIELPDDINAARKVGAEGIGLYRTEFLYLNRSDLPDEEEQLAAYVKVIRAMKGAPVTIRTMDLGADKPLEPERGGHTNINPALGLRAVRLCLREPALFRPQLRALLRASARGKIRIMLPMISSLDELLGVKRVINEVRRELDEEGIKHDPEVPMGVMIEVPAAALAARMLAPHVDFMSLGTNDLIQYTLAIDRLDDEVNYLYDPLHPAVLQLISMTITAGHEARIPVSMCGEMAADALYTRLLLGLGLTEFSVPPAALLEVKDLVAGSNTRELGALCRELLHSNDAGRIQALLRQINTPAGGA